MRIEDKATAIIEAAGGKIADPLDWVKGHMAVKRAGSGPYTDCSAHDTDACGWCLFGALQRGFSETEDATFADLKAAVERVGNAIGEVAPNATMELTVYGMETGESVPLSSMDGQNKVIAWNDERSTGHDDVLNVMFLATQKKEEDDMEFPETKLMIERAQTACSELQGLLHTLDYRLDLQGEFMLDQEEVEARGGILNMIAAQVDDLSDACANIHATWSDEVNAQKEDEAHP